MCLYFLNILFINLFFSNFTGESSRIRKKVPVLKIKKIKYQTPLRKLDDNLNVNLCRYCYQNFGRKFNQTRHENNCSRNRKNILGTRFFCNNCGSNFKHDKSLRRHKINDCGMTHKCKKCEKVFGTLRTLKVHVRKCRKNKETK